MRLLADAHLDDLHYPDPLQIKIPSALGGGAEGLYSEIYKRRGLSGTAARAGRQRLEDFEMPGKILHLMATGITWLNV